MAHVLGHAQAFLAGTLTQTIQGATSGVTLAAFTAEEPAQCDSFSVRCLDNGTTGSTVATTTLALLKKVNGEATLATLATLVFISTADDDTQIVKNPAASLAPGDQMLIKAVGWNSAAKDLAVQARAVRRFA